MCIYIYIYTHIHIYIYIYIISLCIYIYITCAKTTTGDSRNPDPPELDQASRGGVERGMYVCLLSQTT